MSFTRGPLGTVRDEDASRFADPVVLAGDEGVYHGAHPQLEGWHMVRVEREGEQLYVPVHPAQFEVA